MLIRNPASVKGFQEVINLQGWDANLTTRSTIFGYLAARLNGDEMRGKKFLEDSIGKLKKEWPEPIVGYFRGEIEEAALLKLATESDKLVDMRCLLGLESLINGENKQAVKHFLWVKEHGNTSLLYQNIAESELDRLDQAAKQPKP